jgi:hypothetical protein
MAGLAVAHCAVVEYSVRPNPLPSSQQGQRDRRQRRRPPPCSSPLQTLTPRCHGTARRRRLVRSDAPGALPGSLPRQALPLEAHRRQRRRRVRRHGRQPLARAIGDGQGHYQASRLRPCARRLTGQISSSPLSTRPLPTQLTAISR